MSDTKEIIPIDEINENASEKEESSIAKFFKKPSVIIILLLIIGWAVTYFYMSYNHTQKVGSLEKSAKEMMFEQDKSWIEQTIKPLSWAIRSEMRRNNNEEVDAYQNEFVRFPGFSNLMIIDNEGEVIVSTDKKFENSAFASHFDTSFINQNNIVLQGDLNDSKIMISAPIMGIGSRLGTLFVMYTIEDGKYDIAK